MAFIEAFSKEGDGTLFTLGGGDALRVGAGVELLSFGAEDGTSAAVQGHSSRQTVTVYGAIRSQDCGIELGNDSGDSFARVVIGTSGVLTSLSGARGALHVTSQAFYILNAGLISGEVGLNVTTHSAPAAWIENRGTIAATGEAVVRLGAPGGETGRLVLVNRGWIVGGAASYDSQAPGLMDVDLVHNYGRMVGDVRLGLGNDVYAGHGAGRVSGRIFGQGGDDIFRPGRARERMDGGEGMDVLDFSAGPAVSVALNGAAGTGRALGDEYISFEIVHGSRRGGDRLRGSEADEQLFGRGGHDWLHGAGGDDQITGGVGRDTLRGGEGSDDFIFNHLREVGDVITDFNMGAGTDRIVINLAGFRGGLGVVDPNPSIDIRYETHTGKLWLDLDGAGGQKPFLLARFTAGAPLSDDDFLFLGAGSPAAFGF